MDKNRLDVESETIDSALDIDAFEAGSVLTDQPSIEGLEASSVDFTSESYLGLDIDQRIKDAAIDAVKRYGIQYPSSRTYVSSTLYTELEDLLGDMFGASIVVATSLNIGHQAVMPIVIQEDDALIIDQRANKGVLDIATKMQLMGVAVSMIPHNDLTALDEKLKTLSALHKRIWYVFDGVYSIYGDAAPAKELHNLLDRYKSLHLYADDAQGMSWAGKHGTGYLLSQMKLHPRMILGTSLNKAFAAGGSVFVISDKELSDRVRRCGGPLIFAGQHQTSALAASICSARIHLSGEISERQEKLHKKIALCNSLLREFGVPHVVSDAPIFFIGIGMERMCYDLFKRMNDDGFKIGIAISPAVQTGCAGMRISITLNHTDENIEHLLLMLGFNYAELLKKYKVTAQELCSPFNTFPNFYVPEETSTKQLNSKRAVQEFVLTTGG